MNYVTTLIVIITNHFVKVFIIVPSGKTCYNTNSISPVESPDFTGLLAVINMQRDPKYIL